MESPLGKYICNYRLNIIDPYTMEDNSLLTLLTENRTVLHLLRRSNDRNILDIPPEFLPPDGRLSEEGSTFVGEMLQIDLSAGKEKEGYNMCLGMDLLKKDLMEKGRQEGRQQGMQEERDGLVITMLGKQISPDQIHRMTDIPLSQIFDIAKGNGILLGK